MLLVAAAETVGAQGLAKLAALGRTPPVLLLAPARAAALRPPSSVLRPVAEEAVVAFACRPRCSIPGRCAAWPTRPPRRCCRPPPGRSGWRRPALAGAALALAKLGRLLPALVAAPVRDGAGLLRHDLLSVEAEQVLGYPAGAAASLRRVAEAAVPLEAAPDARIIAFRAADGGIEHLAILIGRPEDALAGGAAPLARMHSECFTGDLLGSLRCDCGPQLQGSSAAWRPRAPAC